MLSSDNKAGIITQVNALPLAVPTCFNVLNDLEKSSHSAPLIFCTKCKTFFCSRCADFCVFSSAVDISFTQKPAIQGEHNQPLSKNSNFNINDACCQVFGQTNALIDQLKEWGIGNVTSAEIVDSYSLFVENIQSTVISPYFTNVLINPLKSICEKVAILKKAEDNVIRFSEMFSNYNKKANNISKNYQTRIHPLVEKFFTKYLELSNYADTDNIEWKDIGYNNPIECCIVGIPNSGKTTLLNALLGKDLLPTKEGRCTVSNTQLLYADKKERRVDLLDEISGYKTEFNSEQLMEFDKVPPQIISTIGEKSNVEKEKDKKTQKTVRVYWDNLLLKSGIVFSDTPGYDDISEQDALAKKLSSSNKDETTYIINAKTLEFINRASLVLVVVDMGHTYTSQDSVLNFLSAKEIQGKKIMVILNKGNLFGKIRDLEDRGWESFVSFVKQHEKLPMTKFFKQINEKSLHTPFESSLLNHWEKLGTRGIMIEDLMVVSSIEALNDKIQGNELDATFQYLENCLFRNIEFITKSRVIEFSKNASMVVDNILQSSLLCKDWYLHMANMKSESELEYNKVDKLMEVFESDISNLIEEMRDDIYTLLAKSNSNRINDLSFNSIIKYVKKDKIMEALRLIHAKVMSEYSSQLDVRRESLGVLGNFGVGLIFLVLLPISIILTPVVFIGFIGLGIKDAIDVQNGKKSIFENEFQSVINLVDRNDISGAIDELKDMYPKKVSGKYHEH